MLLASQNLPEIVTFDGYIIGIVGTFISILLVIIGFFLKSLIYEIRETRDSVIELTANYINQEKKCVLAHGVVDTRLNEHSKMINKHETEIGILKAKQ